jgi:uncharacterized integral membrane protein
MSLLIGAPAAALRLDRPQAQAVVTCAYLALLHALTVSVAAIATRPSPHNELNQLVFLIGTVALVLAVRAGQPRRRLRTGSPRAPADVSGLP